MPCLTIGSSGFCILKGDELEVAKGLAIPICRGCSDGACEEITCTSPDVEDRDW
jgi:hypothetical protein